MRRASKAAAWAALAAAAGWTAARYRRDIRRARARVALGGRMIATRCGPVEYAEAGDGRPLLAIQEIRAPT